MCSACIMFVHWSRDAAGGVRQPRRAKELRPQQPQVRAGLSITRWNHLLTVGAYVPVPCWLIQRVESGPRACTVLCCIEVYLTVLYCTASYSLQARLGVPSARRARQHLQQQQHPPQTSSRSSQAALPTQRRLLQQALGSKRWTSWLWALLMRHRRRGHVCWRGCRSSAVALARPLRTSSVSDSDCC